MPARLNFPLDINEEIFFYIMYQEFSFSSYQIADILDYSRKTVTRRLDKYNIDTRKTGVSKGRYNGENNPNYGKKHSKETRDKISEKVSGKNHPLYGVRGEDHPNWKPYAKDYKELRKRIENIKQYKDFKQKVRERDNGTCQICDEYGIEVHHIKKVSDIFYNEYFNNFDNIKEFRNSNEYLDFLDKITNPDEAITLCKRCHYKIRGNEEEYEDEFREKIKSDNK